MKNKLNQLQIVLVVLVLFVSFGARLYKINSPLADWHSWRQADTSAVTRNFLKFGFNPLVPKFDDLSNVASGLENPNGYRMVEFPLFNTMHLLVYKMLPGFSLEAAGRLTSVFFSIMGMYWLFKIVNKLSGYWTALAATAVMGLMPYSIFYSRVILPDMMMVSLALGSSWHLIKAEGGNKKTTRYVSRFVSALLMAGALLVKPTGVFFLLALLVWLVGYYRKAILKNWLWILIYLAVVLTPLVLWRLVWIVKFPEGIAHSSWLLNGNGIRGKGAWWRWLFQVRVGTLMLGVWGVALLIRGMSEKIRKEDVWYWSLGGAMFLYLLIFATGNVQHDYYQIPLIPVVSIFVAKGIYALLRNKPSINVVGSAIGIVCLAMGLAFAWYDVRGYYQINNPAIVEAGKIVDERVPKDAKVIAPYSGDTAFLYQTNRQGWPVVTEDMEKYLNKGATHYVSVNYDEFTKKLQQEYEVILANDKFIILDLTKQK